MRALRSDKRNCSHNVSQKLKRIRLLFDVSKLRKGLPEQEISHLYSHMGFVTAEPVVGSWLCTGFVRPRQ